MRPLFDSLTYWESTRTVILSKRSSTSPRQGNQLSPCRSKTPLPKKGLSSFSSIWEKGMPHRKKEHPLQCLNLHGIPPEKRSLKENQNRHHAIASRVGWQRGQLNPPLR